MPSFRSDFISGESCCLYAKHIDIDIAFVTLFDYYISVPYANAVVLFLGKSKRSNILIAFVKFYYTILNFSDQIFLQNKAWQYGTNGFKVTQLPLLTAQ